VEAERALRDLLLATQDVAELVGDGIHPVHLPQGFRLPAVSYQRISGPRIRAHEGPSGLARPRIQVDCWAETYAAAKELARRVRQSVDGWRGESAGIRINDVSVVTEMDGYEPDTGIWRVQLDLIVWHEEATS